MAGMTPTQSTLIVAQRPLDELRAPKSFIRRRICGPGESTQLTAEEYLALSKQLDEQGAIEPRDAAGTEVNIGGILNKWNRYELESAPQYSSHVFRPASFELC